VVLPMIPISLRGGTMVPRGIDFRKMQARREKLPRFALEQVEYLVQWCATMAERAMPVPPNAISARTRVAVRALAVHEECETDSKLLGQISAGAQLILLKTVNTDDRAKRAEVHFERSKEEGGGFQHGWVQSVLHDGTQNLAPLPAKDVDVETLQLELKASQARAQRLAAAVEAERNGLARAMLTEVSSSSVQPQRRSPVEEAQQLKTIDQAIAQTRQLRDKELQQLKASLDNPNVQLALAVTGGVDAYFGDVTKYHALRRAAPTSDGPSGGSGKTARELKRERERLEDEARSLAAKTKELEEKTRVAMALKRVQVDELHNHDARRLEF
jgi:hypothetical protein